MQNTPHPPRRMVVYTRISDDREGRQNGTDRQERQCRALADRNGDEVVAVFTDDDRSAYSGKPRPGYRDMLKFLRDGHADGVLALAPTRLYRRLDDGLDFFRLITEKGLEVETVKAGRYNLSTADGRRDALRAAIDAQHEAELIAERVRDAKADNLRDGTYRGGPRPFGYEGDGVTIRSLVCPRCFATEGFSVDRECSSCGEPAVNAEGSEAWHLEQASNALVAGDSLRSICRTLAGAGVRTVPRRYKQPDGTRGEPEDREWRAEELRKLLMRPRNAGLMEKRTKGPDGKLHSEIVGRAAWAPIVSEETWRACLAVLSNPERRTTTSNARVWLGSGLYRCGVEGCEETMRCSTSGKGPGRPNAISYRCRSGPHLTRIAAPLDEFIETLVLERLARPDAVETLLPPPRGGEVREDLAKSANELRAKLDGLAADFAADLITRQQLLDGTALTRKRLEAVESKMEAQSQHSVLAGLPLGDPDRLDAEWPDYHLDKRQAIVNALMTVTLMPGRPGRPAGTRKGMSYFDPSSVRIDWKHPG